MSRLADTRRFPDSWVQMCLRPLPKSHQAGLGCAQHWNPLERKGWEVPRPPRRSHSSSRHAGATSSWVTQSHAAAEKHTFWASFPVPCADCQRPAMKTQFHSTVYVFLVLVFINHQTYSWKHLSRKVSILLFHSCFLSLQRYHLLISPCKMSSYKVVNAPPPILKPCTTLN